MAWQDMFAGSTPRINAEYEQELHLADQARLGADWALGALIARYQPTVSRYLTRLTGNSTRARLISEQIFLRMERRLHGPHGGQHLRLWLLRSSTEAGLDELRKPHHTMPQVQLEASSSHPRALLPEVPSSQHYDGDEPVYPAYRTDTGKTAGPGGRRGSTRRQLRQLIWTSRSDAPADDETSSSSAAAGAIDTQYQKKERARGRRGSRASSGGSSSSGRGQMWDDAEPPEIPVDEEDILEPREVLRFRMIRAVLAELPYGDAQCLALHLIANLNQAEVSRALGITASATRKRIVSGLQLFAQRYEAASASLGISLDMMEGARRTEVTEDMEDEELFALPGQRDEATPPPLPSHREPVVVSAAMTNPLTLEDTGAGEEPVIVWDLPPFEDVVNIETQPLPYPVEVSEPEEPPTAQEEAGGVNPEDVVTRRLVWSRPAASRHTPVTPGDEVTTRLEKPRRRSAATVGDAPSSSASSSSSSSAGATSNSGGAAVEDRVKETLEETWTYTENIETISEPPPEALIVDAGPPVASTRTVPVLTTLDKGPRLGASHSESPAPGLGSSTATIAGDGEARVISVLTPPTETTSPGDMPLHSNGSGESGSGDQYDPSAS